MKNLDIEIEREIERAMVKLPDDLIGCDILTRFPVKSLLRFRCVSKTWCALIDNNSFVKQHLNHSILTKNNHTLILKSSFIFHSLGLCSLSNKPLKLVPPIDMPLIFGSCNGLLCLSYIFDTSILMLWNPATRKHLRLPVAKPHRNCAFNYGFGYGFGYDSISDDYKVVKIIIFSIEDDKNSFIWETMVYNMKTNSWRIMEDSLHYLIDNGGSVALAFGVLHWMGWDNSDSRSRLVIAFDLVTEKYKVVTLSKDLVMSRLKLKLGSELGGCLSIVCLDDNSIVGVFDVWVMKDYGVMESWTKLLTISYLDIDRTNRGVVPLAYSESGDEVLLLTGSTHLIWYNLEMRTSKVVDISGIRQFSHLMISLESLVSLGEKAENDEKQGEEYEGAKEESE